MDAPEIRQRNLPDNTSQAADNPPKLRKQSTFDGVDSDDDRPFDEVPDLSKTLPQDTGKTMEVLDAVLSYLPAKYVFTSFSNAIRICSSAPFLTPMFFLVLVYLSTRRWRNYVVRSIFTFALIAFFAGLIYLGPLALMFTVSRI